MKWLIFIIATSLPSYLIRFKIGPISATVLEILILFTFGVWLFLKLRREELFNYLKSFPRPWLVIIILWLITATISIFFSPNTRAALGIWKAYFVEPLLFFLVFIDVIKNRQNLNLVFGGLGISAIYISIVAVLQKLSLLPIPTPWQSELRVTSIFEYPNAVGLFLGPLVPIFIIESRIWNLEYRIYKKIFFALTTILSIAAIALAKSEGAILGIAAGLFIMGLFWGKRARIATMAFTAIAAIILFSVPICKNYIIEKAALRDWSGYVRKKMWSETWQMLRAHPITGAGLAGYQTVIAPYHKTQGIEIFLYPHNIFLNFWSELGFLGLAVFLWLITLFFVEAKHHSKNKAKICLIAAVAVILVHGLVDVPYFKNDLSVLFWLIIGASIETV